MRRAQFGRRGAVGDSSPQIFLSNVCFLSGEVTVSDVLVFSGRGGRREIREREMGFADRENE